MFNNTVEKKAYKAGEIVESTNVISKETKIIGNINALGNIRVEGAVEGAVHSKAKIILGDSSMVKGNLHSDEAEISGSVDGDVFCTGLLVLKKTALIKGNIVTPKIVIENGAIFNGKCQMTNSGSFVVSKGEPNGEQKQGQYATG
jgi:cytoskeletal protein CcmA (bactofilin family)